MKTGLAVFCLALIGCGVKPHHPGVRLAVPGPGLQTFDLPFHLAETLGFYSQEGLDVELQRLPSHTQTMQALIGGSVDVAAVTYPQVVQVAAKGSIVRSFAVVTRIDTKTLAVAPSWTQRIQRVEDLKGTAIGIPSPGTACHQWIIHYLAKHGIRPEEVSFISVGVSGTALAAMESGRIGSACLPGGDHFHYLRRHPDARILVDGSTRRHAAILRWALLRRRGPRGQTGMAGSASGSRRKLASAALRAQGWIAQHTTAEVRARLPEAMRSSDERLDCDIISWGRAGYTPDGAMPQGAPELVKRYLEATVEEVRTRRVDLASTWTNEFLKAAK